MRVLHGKPASKYGRMDSEAMESALVDSSQQHELLLGHHLTGCRSSGRLKPDMTVSDSTRGESGTRRKALVLVVLSKLSCKAAVLLFDTRASAIGFSITGSPPAQKGFPKVKARSSDRGPCRLVMRSTSFPQAERQLTGGASFRLPKSHATFDSRKRSMQPRKPQFANP